MTRIADINGGTVRCDVCGDGTNRLALYLNEHAGRITIERTSRCYGDDSTVFYTLEEALKEWDRWSMLMSMRSSVRAWGKARRQLVRDWENKVPEQLRGGTNLGIGDYARAVNAISSAVEITGSVVDETHAFAGAWGSVRASLNNASWYWAAVSPEEAGHAV